MEKEIMVEWKQGLDPRKIAHFVQIANQFASKIYVDEDTMQVHVNAKSIMGMMSLNLKDGGPVKICAKGEDAEEAAEALEKFLTEND